MVDEIIKVLEDHQLLGAIMYCLSERERRALIKKLEAALLQTTA